MKHDGQCALCKKKRTLCQSHIFPNFFFNNFSSVRLNQNKRRVLGLSTNPNERIPRPFQTGAREYLLCQPCDRDIIGPCETHARNVLFGKSLQDAKEERFRFVHQVDYMKFKVFQLSLIWRASVTTRNEFKAVKLEPTDRERLRCMILERNPGQPWEYPCRLMALPPQFYQQVDLSDCILFPFGGKIQNMSAYYSIIGGLVWEFIITSNARSLPHFNDVVLSKTGELPILKGDIRTIAQVWDNLIMVSRAIVKKPNINQICQWGFHDK